jgi:hypothetical protein
MNGATITTTGDFAVIHINGIDSGADLRKILRAAVDSGGRRGTVFTGRVVNAHLLEKYERLARLSKPHFRRRVTKIGPERFRLDYDRLPSVK